MLEAKRTLVKSGPELWAEVSDPGALARHLAPFGSITISRKTPESSVCWQGERASGELTLEPSGFGTKVTITAQIAGAEPEPGQSEPEPEQSEPAPRRSFWGRLLRRPEPPVAPPVATEPAPAPEGGSAPMAGDAAMLVLTDTLDALGKARHRPFSRV